MKHLVYKINIFLMTALLSMNAGATSKSKVIEDIPPNEGNFALPTSQQPGPFLSFGQNLINKNQIQAYMAPSYLYMKNGSFLTMNSSIVYGVSDEASFLASVPFAVNYTYETLHARGVGDVYFQGEYALYDKTTVRGTEQLTVVAGIGAPTGSFSKNPPTGLGATSYFIGGTYNRMSVEWLAFTSSGLTLVEGHDHTKLGNQYLYQMGLGHNIKSETGKYIFFGLVELNGFYIDKSKIKGEFSSGSGGNLTYIIPSLWFSTKKLFFQLGAAFPVSQTLHSNQVSYNLVGIAGIVFN